MSPYERRKILIDKMDQDEPLGFNCQGCKGTCCTFEANSMLITPLEALDLIEYLKDTGLTTPELKKKLELNVEKYKLEPKYTSGRRSYLRKTYTCPFFGNHELGCPLPREIKPYGCLAFDSHHVSLKASEHCYSEKELLEKREKKFSDEEKLNEEIRKKFQLLWEKSPISNALLELWEKI